MRQRLIGVLFVLVVIALAVVMAAIVRGPLGTPDNYIPIAPTKK